MNTRVTASILMLAAAAAALPGCVTSRGPTADDLLAGAHWSLSENDTETAREWLTSAEQRLKTNQQWKEHQLLTAELDLATGNAELSLPAVEHLLDRYPKDPRAHEVAGKIHLSMGEFATSTGHFAIAAGRYTKDGDIARATDLLTLSEGLEAYSKGNVALARERWRAIQDPSMRAEVLGGSDEPQPEEAGADALARSTRLTP